MTSEKNGCTIITQFNSLKRYGLKRRALKWNTHIDKGETIMRKTTWKKVVSASMISVMTASLCVGCGGSNDDGASEQTYTIGICQLVQHDALDAATQGFQDALTEKLGENVTFDLQNAAGDSPTCSTIVNQFVTDDVDLIMANATPALQAAMAATAEIPIVATSITDFGTALDMSDWKGVTGINVTGTADLAPLAEQAAMIQEVCPDAKTVGILYCSAEANSKYQADVITEELDALGLKATVYTVAETNEIASVTTKACEEVDVLYIPTDNTIASATSAVNEIAAPANVPVIAGEAGICQGCGVATLSISYYSLGQKAGEMAYEILVNGADPAEMEIEYAEELTKQYIPDRAEALGLTIPYGYEAMEASAE